MADKKPGNKKPPDNEVLNRRKYLRVPLNIRCDIFDTFSAVSLGTGHLVDFSLGGLGLATTTRLPVPMEARLRLNLPIKGIILYVRVVYVRQIMGDVFIYGTRYSGLNMLQRFNIRRKLSEFFKK